jgi:hypothetical protein
VQLLNEQEGLCHQPEAGSTADVHHSRSEVSMASLSPWVSDEHQTLPLLLLREEEFLDQAIVFVGVDDLADVAEGGDGRRQLHNLSSVAVVTALGDSEVLAVVTFKRKEWLLDMVRIPMVLFCHNKYE